MKSMKTILFLAACFLTASFNIYAYPIMNPYYPADPPSWKLWDTDSTPVTDAALIAPGQVGSLSATAVTNNMYPDDMITPGKFMEFKKTDWVGRKYAGFLYDVYCSVDGNSTTPETPHSYIGGGYFGDTLNTLWWGSSPWINAYKGNIQSDPGIDKFGVNFTSQSTTIMGHDIANSGTDYQYGTLGVEKRWYFKNCLRAGPAHISYTEFDDVKMDDLFEAYAPCYFDSLGSSGSEVYGLLKMAIAGAFMPIATKQELKRQGIYIATLLYMWKACLPYDAPYESELRHRVAYITNGNSYVATKTTHYNDNFHMFNDALHMGAMVAMAKTMTVAPPITLIREVSTLTGTKTYFNKTCALYQQAASQQVQVVVSVSDSYDIQGRPLTFKTKVICGNPDTIVSDEGGGDYRIIVPANAKLPDCRTSVIFVANNGVYDSNPAVVNIYYNTRGAGKQVNYRPVYTGDSKLSVYPGYEVTFNLRANDPEGFTCSFYKRTEDMGALSGNTFTWTCPTSVTLGEYTVPILISDGTTGTSNTMLTIVTSYSMAPAVDEFAQVKTYPNPANITLGATAKIINLTGNCVVEIFDSNGAKIRELKEAEQTIPNGGMIEWDGRNSRGDLVGRGIYMYVLKSPTGSKKTGKLAILK